MLSTFYTIVMISGDIAAISRLASSSTLTLQYLTIMHKLCLFACEFLLHMQELSNQV